MSNMSRSAQYCSRFFLGAVRANCQTLNGYPLTGKTLTGNDRAKSAVACVK
jgi:hypothetical protein